MAIQPQIPQAKARHAVIDRLVARGVPETDIRRAIALVFTGRVDLIASVAPGREYRPASRE
jgi:hypothetical protein